MGMSVEEKPNFKVPNLERALQILEFMVKQDDELSQREIALTLEYPVNSVMRILNALEYYGYLHRNTADKKYSLSNKLSSMARSSARQHTLMEASLDIMRELRDEIGETVVISIIDGNEGLILEQIQGIHPFRFVCDPGTRQTIHCSASCKAIMAFMPEKDRERIIDQIRFEKLTPTTLTSPKAFREELVEVMRTGYAVDRAEDIEGVYCVAAPIQDPSGTAVAAITMTGPSNRVKLDDLPRIGEIIKAHTARISSRLGF